LCAVGQCRAPCHRELAQELLEHHRTHARVFAQSSAQRGVDSVRGFGRDVLTQHGCRVALEKGLPRQQLMHQSRQVVDQRPLIYDAPLHLLGCNGLEWAKARPSAGLAHGEAGHSQCPLVSQNHVCAEVSVDDPNLLRGKESLSYLCHHGCSLLRRKPSALRLQAFRQRRCSHRRVHLVRASAVELPTAEDP